MGERERVDQLELVVEVVLEPEHDLELIAERVEQPPVAPLQRREELLLSAPAAVGEEPGACAEQLAPWQRRHRSLVQHVLPGQDDTAKRRLPERVAGALAVRDVEQRGLFFDVHACTFRVVADPHAGDYRSVRRQE